MGLRLPSAYTGKAISGNAIKNDSSTLLNAGNVNPALANNLTLSENAGNQSMYGSQMVASVSPTSSGNVGIGKAISNGTFNTMTEGEYVARMLGTKIAGTNTNLLKSPAGDKGNRRPNKFQGYRRYHNVSWDAKTGALTKGSEAGVAVLASGINGQTGAAADHAVFKYGEGVAELTFMQGDSDPTSTEYKTQTSP